MSGHSYSDAPPRDIKPTWLSVIRKLQAVAERNHGACVMQLNVIVNDQGNPVFWAEPTLTRLEPRASAEQIIAIMTGKADANA